MIDEVTYEMMRAMPTAERRAKLQACFAAMRLDGCGLNMSQEALIMDAMEVR